MCRCDERRRVMVVLVWEGGKCRGKVRCAVGVRADVRMVYETGVVQCMCEGDVSVGRWAWVGVCGQVGVGKWVWVGGYGSVCAGRCVWVGGYG